MTSTSKHLDNDRNEPMTTPTTCTVYFDGACPVCRTEIAHYQRQRGAEAIAWVDASSCDAAALGPGVDRTMLLSRFHIREADGSLTSGAAWAKKAGSARGSQVIPSGYPDTFPAVVYQQEI